MEALEEACPPQLAANWDNVGLHTGDPARQVERILVALDADEMTIDAAVAAGADLLVTHHPLYRQPPVSLSQQDPDGRRVAAALRADLAVYSLHTNFDVMRGGVSDVLAERLGLSDVRVLVPHGDLRKIVVFVPEEHVDTVFDAMAAQGAGAIGGYRGCSYRSRGRGTFVSPPDAHPSVGRAGQVNDVEETRLETIVPAELVPAVTGAMVEVHPYEEVAYDVYALAATRSDVGIGRLGSVAPTTLADFARECARRLQTTTVRCAGKPEQEVVAVAVCGGSGSALIEPAAKTGAHVLVSGDVGYHDAQRALGLGLGIIDAGHDATEAPAVAALARLVGERATAIGYTGLVESFEKEHLFRLAGGDSG